MSFVQQGIERDLVRFDEEEKFITYIHQDKRRSYSNPEERVQAETFLKLILIWSVSASLCRCRSEGLTLTFIHQSISDMNTCYVIHLLR
jgi:hypothetical protein